VLFLLLSIARGAEPAPTPRRPGEGPVELAVGPWIGEHAPQGEARSRTGVAGGGLARVRWTEVWGAEALMGAFPAGPAGTLSLVHFLGDPSADLVGHVTLGIGLRADRAGLLAVGGGLDVVLTSWLDLRAAARLEVATDGGAALLFGVAPVVHTRRRYDADSDGVPDRADACPRQPEDRDGRDDVDGCPDPDNDGDGVPDLQDTCADVPEDPDGYHDKDGCPDPDDDEDGVFDALDRCRDAQEDMDGHDDLDGCPDPDDDGDLVRDEYDRCGDVKEDPDGFEDDDGCPEPDNDGDGIADQWDGDPLAPETWNGWLDGDGLPDAPPPVLARLIGPMALHFDAHGEPRPLGDAVERLADVLASFPEARVLIVVTAPSLADAEARGALLLSAVQEAGAAEGQVSLRALAGPEGVTLSMQP
jgi:hypothetical protein